MFRNVIERIAWQAAAPRRVATGISGFLAALATLVAAMALMILKREDDGAALVFLGGWLVFFLLLMNARSYSSLFMRASFFALLLFGGVTLLGPFAASEWIARANPAQSGIDSTIVGGLFWIVMGAIGMLTAMLCLGVSWFGSKASSVR